MFKTLFWQAADGSVGPLCASTVERSPLGISVLLLHIAPDLLMFLGIAPLAPVSGVRCPVSWGQQAKADNWNTFLVSPGQSVWNQKLNLFPHSPCWSCEVSLPSLGVVMVMGATVEFIAWVFPFSRVLLPQENWEQKEMACVLPVVWYSRVHLSLNHL